MARHLDIADAVVTALNGEAFSIAFTAARAYAPVTKREDLADLHVWVLPATYETESADRARTRKIYGVDIAIQKAVDPDSNAACDALFELRQEIEDFFGMSRVPGLAAASWQKTETVPGAEAGYAPQHLRELRIFTGLVRLTWKVIEA